MEEPNNKLLIDASHVFWTSILETRSIEKTNITSHISILLLSVIILYDNMMLYYPHYITVNIETYSCLGYSYNYLYQSLYFIICTSSVPKASFSVFPGTFTDTHLSSGVTSSSVLQILKYLCRFFCKRK